MRILIIITLFVISSSSLNAQLVRTFAGAANTPTHINGVLEEARFNNPHDIEVDELGNIYVADRWNHCIRMIDVEGNVTTIAGVPGQSGYRDGNGTIALFNEPWGIHIKEGIVYIADTRNNRIRKINPTGEVSTIAGNGDGDYLGGNGINTSFFNPTDLTVTTDNEIIVVDHLNHCIRKINEQGDVTLLAGVPKSSGFKDGASTESKFYRPYGLLLTEEGELIIADEWNHRIRKIGLDDTVRTIVGSGQIGFEDTVALAASLSYPWDISLDNYGNLFISDGYNYCIRKVDSEGNVTTFVGTPEEKGYQDGIGAIAKFNGATAITYDPNRSIFLITDPYNNTIRSISDLNEGIILEQINKEEIICEGDELEFQILPDTYDFYEVYIADTLAFVSNDATFQLDARSGIYTIKTIVREGQFNLVSNPVSIDVDSILQPIIMATDGTVISQNQSTELYLENNYTSVLWSTGATTSSIIPTNEGLYDVTVFDAKGCSKLSDEIQITKETLEEDNLALFIPNTFTPNGDALNDKFQIFGLPSDNDMRMEIYNHWGQMLFAADGSDLSWDGRFRGTNVPEGVYTYLVQIISNGLTTNHQGQVTIIR